MKRQFHPILSLACSSLLTFGLLTVGMFPSIGSGATVVLNPERDATLYDDAGGTIGNGSGRYFFVGKPRLTGPRRALLSFDVASCIPPGAIINSVTLQVNLSRTRTADQDIELHRVLADWGEGASDAGGSEGQGTGAATGDATWVHTFFNTSSWTSPGGDFSPTVSATIPVGNALVPYTWGSTSQMVADVQDWLDNPATNHGWAMTGPEAFQSAKRFESNDSPTEVNRPRLTIDYTADCFAGSVNSGVGSITDVFFINGSSGVGSQRVVNLNLFEPVQYDMAQAPAGPASFRYVLWVWLNCPVNPTPLKVTGADVLIGCTVNPTPLDFDLPNQPRVCVRSDGTIPMDCRGTRQRNGPSMGPWTLARPGGFQMARSFKLQAIIEDQGAGNTVGFSVTNCISLVIQ